MRYTNEFNIPDTIALAIQADPYDKGDADFSVTGLIQPPQISRLWRDNLDDVEIDLRDEVWKLLGSGVHAAIERATDFGTKERRYFMEVECDTGTYVVSGNQITDVTQARY